MYSQNSSNYGYNENSFGQASFSNQQNFQASNQMGQMQSNYNGQSSPSFGGMQNQQMNTFFPQNTTSMGQDMMSGQFMTGQTPMQGQQSQFNMGYQGNNADQKTGMYMPEPSINQNVTEPTVSIYTTYENLPNYDQNIDLNQVVQSMKALFSDKANWKSKFDAVDNLRILNKYHFKMMNEIISEFGPYILECFESQKTSIAKNILMFSTEVFMNAREVRLYDEIIGVLVPQVINKSISEKSILKKEAESALLFLIQNCVSDCSVITLAKCCLEKNPAVCENALLTLSKVVAAIGDNLPALKFETLQMLMLTLGQLIDCAKKGNMKKLATSLCQDMYRRFGVENYKDLVLATVGQSHPQFLPFFEKAVEEKKDPKLRNLEFSEFRKEKRMSTAFAYQQQKMNPQSVLGDPFGGQYFDQGLQYQNNQMNYMPNMQNMQNYQQGNIYNNGNQQSSLLNGQIGLNFPQNY